jgi:hypothetical protein
MGAMLTKYYGTVGWPSSTVRCRRLHQSEPYSPEIKRGCSLPENLLVEAVLSA